MSNGFKPRGDTTLPYRRRFGLETSGEKAIDIWDHNYWIRYGEWLAVPRKPEIFEARLKIAIRQTGDSIIATIVEGGFILRNNLHILLPLNDKYAFRFILGILNFTLTEFL
jgi:hypothetical protein